MENVRVKNHVCITMMIVDGSYPPARPVEFDHQKNLLLCFPTTHIPWFVHEDYSKLGLLVMVNHANSFYLSIYLAS